MRTFSTGVLLAAALSTEALVYKDGTVSLLCIVQNHPKSRVGQTPSFRMELMECFLL